MARAAAVARMLARSSAPAAAPAHIEAAPAPKSMHPYRGAEQRRQWRGWQPQHRSGDAAITENWDLLTARMRDLCRNEPVMRSLKRAMAKHVVGPGIATFADVHDLAGESDDLVNFEFDDEFEHWSEHEADAEGKFAWPQMQWQHFNEVMESGESFLLECSDTTPGRYTPICFQLLEPEQIDPTKDWASGGKGRENKCVRGIEYDAVGRPVAYWIFDAHPYDRYSGWTAKSTRVPASRVIHSYFPSRASENRGVTWFAANVQSTKDLDWYLGNELTAAALAALLTLVHKRAKGGGGSGIGFEGGASSTFGDTDEWGNALLKWGRGVVAEIPVGDELEVAESKRPSRDAAPFVKLILGLNAMAAGVSPLRVTGDYSQSSYTSARGAHLDDQAFFTVLQNWAIRSFVRKVRCRHTQVAAGIGLYRSVSARVVAANLRNYLRVIAQAPGREQLDPEKETGAAGQRLDACLSTWQDECGARGKNWRRVVMQQARERAFMREYGIEPNLSGGSPPANQPANAGDDHELKTEDEADAAA